MIRTLYAWQMAGLKIKNSYPSNKESVIRRSAGPSAYQFHETMLENEKNVV